MKNCFYNLAGGVNCATTKTELGLDTNRMFWSDSVNVEILQNKGIVRQQGNVLMCSLEDADYTAVLDEVEIKSYPELVSGDVNLFVGKKILEKLIIEWFQELSDDAKALELCLYGTDTGLSIEQFVKRLALKEVTGIFEYSLREDKRIVFNTAGGAFFEYNPKSDVLRCLKIGLDGKANPNYIKFLNGVIVSNGVDEPFFYCPEHEKALYGKALDKAKQDENVKGDFEIVRSCNALSAGGQTIRGNAMAVFRSRVWIASKGNLHFSALGRFDDWSSPEDAGYINNFHADAEDITALKAYKGYLAIYKANATYLLEGNNPEDFIVTPFADKGSISPKSVVNAINKQYIYSNGVFMLEQTGDLGQIQMSSEISAVIKPAQNDFDKTRMQEAISVHYERKNQVWYYIPHKNNPYFNTIWINDYYNKAWFKRCVPQSVTTAALFDGQVVCGTADGKILLEDMSNAFEDVPVNFMWKSPFIALGNASARKEIDEFVFLLDDEVENRFKFSLYKNYDAITKDDVELVFSGDIYNMIWDGDKQGWAPNGVSSSDTVPAEGQSTDGALDSDATPTENGLTDRDSDDNEKPTGPIETPPEQNPAIKYGINWAKSTETRCKAQICESNYSVQLCVEGDQFQHNCAIIGFEFNDIYFD